MDWWVIIILLGIVGVLVIADLRFVYRYMHVDDYKYNQGIIAQVIAVMGMSIMWLVFCLVPTNVYNTRADGGLSMLYFWQLVFLALNVYLTVIMPFAGFYYGADSDPRLTKSPPWRRALVNTGICTAVCWAVIGLLYWLCHNVQVPIDRLACASTASDGTCSSWTKSAILKSGSVAFLTYLVALPGFFGWLVFMIAGGVGLASTPLSAIQRFITRPQPITSQQYERFKKLLGERATALREIGETLKKKEQQVAVSKGLAKSTQRVKLRTKISKFRQAVILLESEYQNLDVSFRKRGMNPVKAWFILLWGILALLLTTVWILQIVLAVFVPQIIGDSISFKFLATALDRMAETRIFGLDFALYFVMTAYMLVAAIGGNVKLALRFQNCLPMEPLRKADTHLNALLYHIAIMMISSAAVVQLSTVAFQGYPVGTEAEAIYFLQKDYMKLFSTFYGNHVFIWIMIIVFVISFVWLAMFPEEKPMVDLSNPKTIAKWSKLQKELHMHDEGNIAEQKTLAAEIHAAPQKDGGPGFGERTRARLNRIDQGIENAPARLFGAGMKGAVT